MNEHLAGHSSLQPVENAGPEKQHACRSPLHADLRQGRELPVQRLRVVRQRWQDRVLREPLQ
jgi:hypothetical protein